MAVTLSFDRLENGGLVSMHTHAGRTVAALVHPIVYVDDKERCHGRWRLAGDVDRSNRPHGEASPVATACDEAAQALGVELGVDIAGWSVESLDEAAAHAPEEEATIVCYCGTVIADLVEETDGTCGAMRCRRIAAQNLQGLIP